ncbi:MAG: T9SS type A sorting domain-containing protein, partial [Clostridium sp.]|nr:T9SS type A sorting domain-containing protein [Clostridium sp.]
KEWVMKLSKCLGFDPEHPFQSLIDIPGGSCITDAYDNLMGQGDGLGRNIWHCALEACKAIGGVLVGTAPATGGTGAVIGGAARAICEFMENGDSFYYDCWKPFREGCTSANGGGGNKAPALRAADDKPNADLEPMEPQSGNYPGYIVQLQTRLAMWTDLVHGANEYMKAFVGDEVLFHSDKGQLVDLFEALSLCSVAAPADAETLEAVRPDNVPVENFAAFIDRYNNYLRHIDGQNVEGELPDIERMDAALGLMGHAVNSVKELGYESFDKMMEEAVDDFIDGYEGESSSVCASVTLKISQTMTMTRQAIRATLEVGNGHETDPIRDAKVSFSVTNPDGVLVGSDIMQISPESLKGFKGALSLDSGWELEAGADGMATILFIPTKNAAPTTPLNYTFNGLLSYLDPFSGLEVTRKFSPATLTVNPSPIIDLHYFMQRDIMGDDPLTADVVEPRVPGEFAVVVNNKGYGTATNVRFVTKQPEIVENAKGLLIDFTFVGSSLAGRAVMPVLSEKIPTEFGDIAANSATYAQWWLEASLMGHFVSYDVQATHLTSYGNEDLSLLDKVDIHELIHGFTPETDGVRAFLVNDITDSYDAPDMVYTSDGKDAESVNAEATAILTNVSDNVWKLTVSAPSDGWNYGNTQAKGLGKRKVAKVVRQSDGKELNADNIWTTYATLNDAHEPTYEDKLHFVAYGSGIHEFLITFEERPEKTLAVESFAGAPEEGVAAASPVVNLTVNFNKAIDPATFTSEDLSLSCQGQKRDASKIAISTANNQSFTLDLTGLTEETGYYVLTVNTIGITDAEGFSGENGASASWVQVIDGKVHVDISANPAGSAQLTPASGQYSIMEPITLNAVPAAGYEFANWTDGDGNIISYETTVTVTPNEDCAYTANLSLKNYRLEIDSDIEGGSISGAGSGIYPHGSKHSLSADPQEGWEFVHWIIDGERVDGESSLDFALEAPRTVSASFALSDPTAIAYIEIDKELKLLPMPMTRYVSIMAEGLGAMTVDFYDIAGHLRLRYEGVHTRQQMDVSHLPTGVYVVTITSAKGTFSRKALKK